MPVTLVTLKKFCSDSGYTEAQVRGKIAKGRWRLGREFTKTEDGNILIIMEGFEAWALSTLESGQPVNQQLKSTSTTKISVAASVSHLSPRPLT